MLALLRAHFHHICCRFPRLKCFLVVNVILTCRMRCNVALKPSCKHVQFDSLELYLRPSRSKSIAPFLLRKGPSLLQVLLLKGKPMGNNEKVRKIKEPNGKTWKKPWRNKEKRTKKDRTLSCSYICLSNCSVWDLSLCHFARSKLNFSRHLVWTLFNVNEM